MSISAAIPDACPVLKRCSSDTLHEDSSDSCGLIVRIVSHANRPVPEWVIADKSAGTAEPVNINCPGSPRLLTKNRAESQSVGASCHSSINLGTSPSSIISGLVSARIKLALIVDGLSIYILLEAACCAVVVFPHHFGPCTNTAPAASNCSESSLSAILVLYLFSAIFTIC